MNVKFNIKSEFPTILKTKEDLADFSLYIGALELGPKLERISDDINIGELEWKYALIGEEDGLNQYVIRVSGEITIEYCSSKDESILKSCSDNTGRMILEIKKSGDSKPIEYELQAPGKLGIKDIKFD